jgi:hypothetical protein
MATSTGPAWTSRAYVVKRAVDIEETVENEEQLSEEAKFRLSKVINNILMYS